MTALRRWWFGADPDNRWVLTLAVALIVAGLAFRSWVSYRSWWVGDDFIFIARVFTEGGTTPTGLLTGFAGHVMPGDFYLTWLMTKASPYNYLLPATGLVLMQAVADVGLLRLLLRAFGRRWGILPPLVVYVATSLTVESAVWWATGIQALPLQISLFWALGCQLNYLRTRRVFSALSALAWVAFGLIFYEKSILVIGALAILTLAYFTSGTLPHRIRQLWTTYRASAVANLALGLAYLPLYVHFGLNFSPRSVIGTPIGATSEVMILRGWGPALLGGPLVWRHDPTVPISFAQPPAYVVLAAWVCLILVARELVRSRVGALRACWLPAFFLVSDVLLVAASRATIIGPVIGYEYRYITELSAVTSVALGLATMPVLGAVESVRVRRASALIDRRRSVAVACALITVLGTYSTYTYAANWHRGLQANKSYISNLLADAEAAPPGTQVYDASLSTSVVLAYVQPNNLMSRILAPVDQNLRYVTAATDQLGYLAPDGHLRQIDVTPVHRNVPSTVPTCGYRVGDGTTTIPLDGPFIFGGWWVKVVYIATADSTITVSAGNRSHQTSVSAGLHTLYFLAGDDRFEEIRLGTLVGAARLCTNDVTVGQPTAQGTS